MGRFVFIDGGVDDGAELLNLLQLAVSQCGAKFSFFSRHPFGHSAYLHVLISFGISPALRQVLLPHV